MKIGELAKRSGLAASRIRFYEASGLISAQRQANGYREYTEQTLQTLGIIICSQQAGFSLDEIRNLLPDPQGAELAPRRTAGQPAAQGGGYRGHAAAPGAEQGAPAGHHRRRRE